MLNFFLNFLLLELTSKLCKKDGRMGRLIFASCLGAAYSMIIFLDGLPQIVSVLLKLVCSLIMVAVAFSFHRLLQYIKAVFVFYFSSLIFLGLIIAICFGMKLSFIAVNNSVVYFDISAGTIIACAFAAYLISCLVIRIYDRVLSRREIYTLFVTYGDNTVSLLAFLDTGNNLYEPFSHSPVIVVDKSKIDYSPKSIRYVPVATVNGPSVLPAFKPDKLVLKSSLGEEIIENAYIAMSDNMPNNGVSALLNYNILSV